ncbi:cytokine receptor common subunit gamma [Gadus morhua]|uniref:Cytokine receptor common subunit gamma-like n=1 Tax=Gadus morhua TaxID=8049 RepID=A0A8C5FPE7_GADMO|nr:cytokine receptor common subunit gamma-like [Gadus morhua]
MKRSISCKQNTGNSMAVRLLLICLTGLVFSEEPHDVKCLVVNVEYVQCMWNGSATPGVNYTFYSRFENGFKECDNYVLENTTIVGCVHTYEELITKRFSKFTTKLKLGNRSFEQFHKLKTKVKLNAPVNLTAMNSSDLNLWYYWNYTCNTNCIESEVRHRINGKEWKTILREKNEYCINLPSNSYLYELQVRGRIPDKCGESEIWSDWSPPVFWGSMRESYGTVTNKPRFYSPVQKTILYVVGPIVFFILVIILVRNERIRVILIPVLPDPGKNLAKILAEDNVEEWLPISKGIKEGFKMNYIERVCSVGDYSRNPQSTSESSADLNSFDHSSGSCASSVATN